MPRHLRAGAFQVRKCCFYVRVVSPCTAHEGRRLRLTESRQTADFMCSDYASNMCQMLSLSLMLVNADLVRAGDGKPRRSSEHQGATGRIVHQLSDQQGTISTGACRVKRVCEQIGKQECVHMHAMACASPPGRTHRPLLKWSLWERQLWN